MHTFAALSFLITNTKFPGSIFIVDPTKEFNMSIDAPAEDYEDLFD